MALTLEQLRSVDAAALACGSVRDSYEFCILSLREIRKLVPFDRGSIFFLDDSAKVFDEHLEGVTRNKVRLYHEIYGESDGGAYSMTRLAQVRREIIKRDASHSPYRIFVKDWEKESHDTRFYREYISQLGIRYSTGIALFDLDDLARALFSFDRTEESGPFTAGEREMLSLLNHHLDNLFRNFFVMPPSAHGDTIALEQGGFGLTARELDISKLLLAGMSPKRIAEKLGISRATVYKHVSNIHAKLGVTSQLELVSKLGAATQRS
ncbi:MAG TPA: helix-turn-helix transcriptional regulator, partial [Atopobiaceae bacterium]|nr:helix-turn-helix transcriptional regulator [Atopobiaceae bacterium]